MLSPPAAEACIRTAFFIEAMKYVYICFTMEFALMKQDILAIGFSYTLLMSMLDVMVIFFLVIYGPNSQII